MEINNRKSVLANLEDYSPFYSEHDYIEITEWANGEGWDINIGTKHDSKHISLHYSELEIINYLTKYLEYEAKENNK